MLESFAFVIALMIILSKTSPLKEYVTTQHVHDLGNLMFAFMVLWGNLIADILYGWVDPRIRYD